MPTPTLYTLGTSDRSPPEFIDLLKSHGITLVMDVRSRNGSRVLHFDESRFHNLSRLLKENGIRYDASLHKVLGGMQNGKMTLGNFRLYQETEKYHSAVSLLKEITLSNNGGVCIICCERNVKSCHRRLIGDTLESEGWIVKHL